jgi:predicted nucleic acid-binding protein
VFTEAVEFLRRREAQTAVATSVVTQMELTVGCRNKVELNELAKFISRFQVLHLLIADSVIAATAITYGEPLATRNRRDFRFIDDLDLVNYP